MKARYLIPLAVFGVMVIFFGIGLKLDPKEVPSPLIDKPAPAFEVTELFKPEESIGQTQFSNHEVSLFNVWASWCVACRQEHPFLMELARRGEIPIYGLNYKDERPDAIRWLGQFGNPYLANAYDREGRVGLDYGVYGVPETFLIDSKGVIRYKHIGPLSEQIWQEKITPEIQRIKTGQS